MHGLLRVSFDIALVITKLFANIPLLTSIILYYTYPCNCIL